MKLYVVTFMEYTNSLKTHIRGFKKGSDIKDQFYIKVCNGELIIKETDIEKYMKYGNGYKTLTYVGELIEDEEIERMKVEYNG